MLGVSKLQTFSPCTLSIAKLTQQVLPAPPNSFFLFKNTGVFMCTHPPTVQHQKRLGFKYIFSRQGNIYKIHISPNKLRKTSLCCLFTKAKLGKNSFISHYLAAGVVRNGLNKPGCHLEVLKRHATFQ